MGNDNFEDRLRKRLRDERVTRGWSQLEVAKKLAAKRVSVHPTAIAKIEAGDRALRINEAVAIADLFGISLDEALGRDVAGIDSEFGYRFRMWRDVAREAVATLEAAYRQLNGTFFELLEFPFRDRHDEVKQSGDEALKAVQAAISATLRISEMEKPTRTAEEMRTHGDSGTFITGGG